MFSLFKKKALGNEDDIVQEIVQAYANERTAEIKMLEYIERQTKTEDEKRAMIQSLERHKQTLHCDAIFNGFKKQLFGANKKGCMLTHFQLSVCFLICTKKYFPEVIIDMLWIDKDELQQAVESLEVTIKSFGYNLPKAYLEMKPIVKEYFEVDS